MGSQESIHLLCICDICIGFASVCPCIHSCSPFFSVDVTFDSSHQEFPLVAKSRGNNRRMWPGYPGSNLVVLRYNQHFCLCFSSCILMFCLQPEVYCLYPFPWSSSECVWCMVSAGGTIVCWVLSVHGHTLVRTAALPSWHTYRCSSVSYFMQYWEICWVPSARYLWFLTIKGAGFNASSNSALHIKGQLFYNWKIREALLYYSFSYWFVKLTHTHLHTSVTDYCELHIQEVSMI